MSAKVARSSKAVKAVDNNARLRELIDATGLSQPKALAVFNENIGVRTIKPTSWQAFLSAKGTARFRHFSDELLQHAEVALGAYAASGGEAAAQLTDLSLQLPKAETRKAQLKVAEVRKGLHELLQHAEVALGAYAALGGEAAAQLTEVSLQVQLPRAEMRKAKLKVAEVRKGLQDTLSTGLYTADGRRVAVHHVNVTVQVV